MAGDDSRRRASGCAPVTTGGPGGLFRREWGDGPRVVLLHGSAPQDPDLMWAEQRRVLAGRYRLVVPDGAPGDLDAEVADLLAVLGDGAHVVGFSYGGLLALLAAARQPRAIRSLTVIEPPVFAVAHGHPAIDRIIAALAELYAATPVLTPARRRAIARMMAERDPAAIAVPLAALHDAPFPKPYPIGGLVRVVRGGMRHAGAGDRRRARGRARCGARCARSGYHGLPCRLPRTDGANNLIPVHTERAAVMSPPNAQCRAAPPTLNWCKAAWCGGALPHPARGRASILSGQGERGTRGSERKR